MVHVSLAEKEQLVKDGYLSKSTLGNLILYNYTDKTTYARHWIPATIESRGTVYNADTGECVARAFDKFFNLNEHETTRLENLPKDEPFSVVEKVDGSLGILFKHEGAWRVCTRGSFHSEQAAEATNMLDMYRLDRVPPGVTLMFEIIYPSNRIIVNYGDKRKLVLLGARFTESGEHLPSKDVAGIGYECGFELPKMYSHSLEDAIALQQTLSWQDEGFVIFYDRLGLRVKVKGAEYMRIAKMKSCLSPLSVWEAMLVGKYEEYAREMPEELRPELEEIYSKLTNQYGQLAAQLMTWSNVLGVARLTASASKEERKEQALKVQKAPKEVQGALFAHMCDKDSYPVLLERMRPTGNSYVELRIEMPS